MFVVLFEFIVKILMAKIWQDVSLKALCQNNVIVDKIGIYSENENVIKRLNDAKLMPLYTFTLNSELSI